MFFENLSFISFDFARATYEPNKAKTDTSIFNHAKSLIKIHQHHFLRFNTDAFACLLVVLAESAIDCCTVNGLLIPHLFHKLLLSRNKVNPEIVRCLLLYQNVCSESMRQHLTETLPQRRPRFYACLGRFRERSISPYA